MGAEFLKNRSAIDNRYSLTSVHIDDSVAPGRRRYGLWVPALIKSLPESPLDDGTYHRYTVASSDIGRLDLIAWRYYEEVSWWWVIAYYNSIKNQITDMSVGDLLVIPYKEIIAAAIERQL